MIDYFKVAKWLLVVSVLSVALVSITTLFPFIVGKYSWFRASIGLASLAFALGLIFNIDSEKVWRRFLDIFKNPLVIAVSIFAAVFVLASLFGVDPGASFWSNFERGEGGLQILCLYAFFLLAVTLFKEEKDWRRLIFFVIIGSLLMVFYGFGAGLKSIDADKIIGYDSADQPIKGGYWSQTFSRFVGPSFGDKPFRFYGSIGNPAYAATYLIFSLAYCLYLLFAVREKKFGWRGYSLTFLSLFFFIFFLLANTRGAFIGLFVAIFAALCYLGFSLKNWRKRFLILGIVIILLISCFVFFQKTEFVQSLPFARIFDLSVFTQTFQHRLLMWNIAFQGWQERPLLGWGPENYLNIFDKHFDPSYFVPGQQIGAWFDRAHSVYFDYLAETGILGLLSYLGIFVAYYWLFFRNTKTWLNADSRENLFIRAWFFVLPIAYLVQGLVLFEVLSIYQQLFIILAFAAFKFGQPAAASNPKLKQ